MRRVGVFPPEEHHATVVEHYRIPVVILLEAEAPYVLAVGVHQVQVRYEVASAYTRHARVSGGRVKDNFSIGQVDRIVVVDVLAHVRRHFTQAGTVGLDLADRPGSVLANRRKENLVGVEVQVRLAYILCAIGLEQGRDLTVVQTGQDYDIVGVTGLLHAAVALPVGRQRGSLSANQQDLVEVQQGISQQRLATQDFEFLGALAVLKLGVDSVEPGQIRPTLGILGAERSGQVRNRQSQRFSGSVGRLSRSGRATRSAATRTASRGDLLDGLTDQLALGRTADRESRGAAAGFRGVGRPDDFTLGVQDHDAHAFESILELIAVPDRNLLDRSRFTQVHFPRRIIGSFNRVSDRAARPVATGVSVNAAGGVAAGAGIGLHGLFLKRDVLSAAEDLNFRQGQRPSFGGNYYVNVLTADRSGGSVGGGKANSRQGDRDNPLQHR